MAGGSVKRKGTVQKQYYFDYSLLFIVLFLLGFGLIMIYSASSYTAFNTYGNASHYLERQLLANGLGLVGMLVISNVPYGVWRKLHWGVYVVAVVSLGLLFSPLAVSSHGATRWIGIPGTGFNIQPAEIAKVAVIMTIASLVCKFKENRKQVSGKGSVYLFAVSLPLFFMIFLISKNLSSALIVLGIAFIMVFVANPKYKGFVLLIAAGIAAAVAVVYVIATGVGSDVIGFRGGRILAWLDPEAHAQDQGFQTLQAMYAIGSGGIWGKGLGQSMQKLSFIPESQNDMIFSIICEELGLFGAIAVIVMFIMLIWRMMIIANNAPDLFGAMLVVGVIGHISLQAILNIAVVTNTIPNTGISLPFISYGGTSAIFLLGEIGVVFSVAKGIALKDHASE